MLFRNSLCFLSGQWTLIMTLCGHYNTPVDDWTIDYSPSTPFCFSDVNYAPNDWLCHRDQVISLERLNHAEWAVASGERKIVRWRRWQASAGLFHHLANSSKQPTKTSQFKWFKNNNNESQFFVSSSATTLKRKKKKKKRLANQNKVHARLHLQQSGSTGVFFFYYYYYYVVESIKL